MQMLYRLSYVGSDAARGKIGCEQESEGKNRPHQSANNAKIPEQGKKSRPDLLLAEKGRRSVQPGHATF